MSALDSSLPPGHDAAGPEPEVYPSFQPCQVPLAPCAAVGPLALSLLSHSATWVSVGVLQSAPALLAQLFHRLSVLHAPRECAQWELLEVVHEH
eukprot:11936540-Heterocapsa_arctica.AAC.1